MTTFSIWYLQTGAAVALISGTVVGVSTVSAQTPAKMPDALYWSIGPMIRGRNYSQGMPMQPVPLRRGGWYFDLPQLPASVHYVTFNHGSLVGKRRLVIRYRIEAAPGVRFLPITSPSSPSIITLYFQRAGDNWSGKRAFEAYRWYATFASQSPITPGDHEMAAPLDANWTAVERSSASNNPVAFRRAIIEADQVGFVLGGGDGYGHGIFATGPARLIVKDFRVE